MKMFSASGRHIDQTISVHGSRSLILRPSPNIRVQSLRALLYFLLLFLVADFFQELSGLSSNQSILSLTLGLPQSLLEVLCFHSVFVEQITGRGHVPAAVPVVGLHSNKVKFIPQSASSPVKKKAFQLYHGVNFADNEFISCYDIFSVLGQGYSVSEQLVTNIIVILTFL